MQGKGPGSISLPLTMLSTAEIELKLGDSTGKQDSYLRAHNLASQTIEKYRKAMQGFAAPNVNKQQSQSWWSKLFQQEEEKQKVCPPCQQNVRNILNPKNLPSSLWHVRSL